MSSREEDEVDNEEDAQIETVQSKQCTDLH